MRTVARADFSDHIDGGSGISTDTLAASNSANTIARVVDAPNGGTTTGLGTVYRYTHNQNLTGNIEVDGFRF